MLNRNLFHILFIAETKIEGTFSNELLKHPGYGVIWRDRKKGAGGLITYIRDDLPVYHRRNLEPESVESICLDVMDSKKTRFIICVCYRSPRFCKVPDFISSLTSAAELMYKSRNELLLLGNFNMDIYTNDDEDRTADKSLSDFCDRFCFTYSCHREFQNANCVVLASHPERYAKAVICISEFAIMTLFM